MKRCVCLLLIAFLSWSLCCFAQRQAVSQSANPAALAKGFVELLAGGDFSTAASNFDPAMKAALPPEKLEELWASLIAQLGPFKRQVSVRIESSQHHNIVLVTCEFETLTVDLKLAFDNARQISGLWVVPSQPSAEYEPPTYAKPDSFQEREVVVGTREWALPGTLALPVGNGPFSALVLVHGSGPHDRDESISPNKPFRDLAWGLASRNVAVLRYEKRTKEHAAQLAPIKDDITVKEEVIEDVLAAVDMLQRTPGIHSDRIFVLGHSLGGMLIPRIGALAPNISGLVVVAGPTRPMEDVILEQMSYIFGLDGALSEAEEMQLAQIQAQVARVRDPSLSVATPATDLPLGVPAKYWLDLRDYDPPEAARKLKQPMLILQGGRDYQVTMQDFEGWQNALSSRQDVQFKMYPRLNHLFIEGEGKSTPAEYEQAGHVAEIVVDDIARWIRQR